MPEDNKPGRGDVMVHALSITVGGQPLRLQTPNFNDMGFDVAAAGSDRAAAIYARRDPITGTFHRIPDDEVMKWQRPADTPAPTFHVGIAAGEQAAAPARAILDKMLEMARTIRRIKAVAADHHTPPVKLIGGDDDPTP